VQKLEEAKEQLVKKLHLTIVKPFFNDEIFLRNQADFPFAP
jgi:hypothetical protein